MFLFARIEDRISGLIEIVIVGEELTGRIVNFDDFLDELTLEKRGARGAVIFLNLSRGGRHGHLYVKIDNREFKTLTSTLMCKR
ncbi:MAG: hypothetical protein XD41_1696 [Desulfonauticus sp. 38_4375]|nr:MAG: hypothetical protein XD41_1696 [Desulfonauticus sp. 38_4375]